MSEAIRTHLLKSLEQHLRFDGRGPEDLRPVRVETGVIKNAEGSARVRIGETEVLAGIKMSVEKPYPDTPEQGNLMVNAELLPLSSPDYEAGPPGPEAVEVARVVDRCIREAKAIDLKKLCITPGESVWSVSVDICTINAAGNVIDAAAFAGLAALINAKFPEVTDGLINYKKLTATPLPLQRRPIAVTILKIGDQLIVDPTDEEEAVIDARLTICIQDDGKLCALQKGGDAALGIADIDAMVSLARKTVTEFRKVLPA